MEPAAKRQKPTYEGTIIHSMYAASTRPVQVVHELGLQNQIDIITLADLAETRTDAHLKLNPNGRVPVYFEGDRENPTFILVESVAIVMYLLEKYDTQYKLLIPPTDIQKRAKMFQFMHYASSTLYPLNADAHLQDNAAVMEKCVKQFKNEVVPFLTRELGDKQYLLGDQYTVADLLISYDLAGLRFFGVWKENEYPLLDAYYERVSQRPSFKAALPMD